MSERITSDRIAEMSEKVTTCWKCGEIKPIDGGFYRSAKYGIARPCKACYAENQRARNARLKALRPHRSRPSEWLAAHLARGEWEDCLTELRDRPWPHAKAGSGYPHMAVNGKTQLVSRLVAFHMDPDGWFEGAHTRHLCGRGHLGCINPPCLAWGTAVENAADKLLHGTAPRGERQGGHRLTADQVLEIRRRVEQGERQNHLAVEFGVTKSTVNMAVLRHTWAWL